MGANWLGALIASAALLYSLRLGYGENLRAKSGVFYLLLVGMIGTLYGASFIPLGWPVALLFPLIGGITFPALLVASQKLGLPWKVVELIIGAELGAFALFSLLK